MIEFENLLPPSTSTLEHQSALFRNNSCTLLLLHPYHQVRVTLSNTLRFSPFISLSLSNTSRLLSRQLRIKM